MASIFENAPKFIGIHGDKAKIAENNGRVLIRIRGKDVTDDQA